MGTKYLPRKFDADGKELPAEILSQSCDICGAKNVDCSTLTLYGEDQDACSRCHRLLSLAVKLHDDEENSYVLAYRKRADLQALASQYHVTYDTLIEALELYDSADPFK